MEWSTGKVPPWEGPVGMQGEGLEAGLSCWGRAGAERTPSLQQNQGVLQSPRPPRVTEHCTVAPQARG